MARQPRRYPQQQSDVDPKIFVYGDGTWSFFPDDAVYPTRAEAERAWESCRRAVWAGTRRFRVPAAASEFDGISDDAADELRLGWQLTVFPLADVLGALARDRESLAAFLARPRTAKPIRDFLDMRRTDLDAVERTARELATYGGWDRPYPHHLNTGQTYSGKDDGGF